MELRTVPFFTNLTDEEITLVREAAEEVIYPAGTTIVKESRLGIGLFLVQSGAVTIQKHLPHKLEVLAKLKAGEFFGEISLLANTPITADVLASRDTVCLWIPEERWHQLIRAYPQIELKILREFVRVLSLRLASTNELIMLHSHILWQL